MHTKPIGDTLLNFGVVAFFPFKIVVVVGDATSLDLLLDFCLAGHDRPARDPGNMLA